MADKGAGKLSGGQSYPSTELNGKGNGGGKYTPSNHGAPSQDNKGSLSNKG